MKLIYRCLCTILGAVLGSGCSDSTSPEPEYAPPQPEYGVPTATVHVTGKTVDAGGRPIPGILVTMAGAGSDTSDAAGEWAIDNDHAFIPCVEDPVTACKVVAEDIDGPDNGIYPDMEHVLNLVQTEPGSGHLDLGTWEQQNVDIAMEVFVEYGPPVAKVPEPEPPRP